MYVLAINSPMYVMTSTRLDITSIMEAVIYYNSISKKNIKL